MRDGLGCIIPNICQNPFNANLSSSTFSNIAASDDTRTARLSFGKTAPFRDAPVTAPGRDGAVVCGFKEQE